MFDTRALTHWPTPEERARLDARADAGEFGPDPEHGFFETVTWGLAALTRHFTWHQMAAFAADNGLLFRRKSVDPRYPGLLFQLVGQRFLSNHVFAADGSVDIGRYVCVGADSAHSYDGAYAAFRLPHVMPQLVLDNRHNDQHGNKLPIRYAKGQEYDLGGPFADQWRLYAPGGYGQDVYQIIATDVMEALARHRFSFDVEIVDHWLFLYAPTAYLNDTDFWAEIDEIRRDVLGKLAHRRYVDRHDEAPGDPAALLAPVGPDRGTRLKQDTSTPLRERVVWGVVLLMAAGLGAFLLLAFVKSVGLG